MLFSDISNIYEVCTSVLEIYNILNKIDRIINTKHTGIKISKFKLISGLFALIPIQNIL